MTRYAFNYPFVDDWHMVSLVVKTRTGEITFDDLWRAYNGHRLFFWHIIMLPLARATYWNHAYEVALNLVAGLGIFGVFVFMLRRSSRSIDERTPYALIPVVALLVFSLNQWCNWAWGRQLLVFLTVLYTVAGFAVVSRANLRTFHILVAAVLGFLASFTFASGLVYWPCVLIVLFLPVVFSGTVRWRLAGIWIACWIVTLALYFYNFEADRTLAHAIPEGESTFLPTRIADIALYTLTYIGASLSYFSGWGNDFRTGLAMALGSAGIAIAVAAHVVLWKRKIPAHVVAPWTACIAYAIGSGLLTAIGRAAVGGVQQAGAQRYFTVSIPFWVAVVALLYLASVQTARPRKLFVAGVCSLIAGLSILTTRQGWYTLDEHQRIWTAEVRRMVTEELDDVPPRLKYPIQRSLDKDLRLLREHELSIYRPEAEAYWRGE